MFNQTKFTELSVSILILAIISISPFVDFFLTNTVDILVMQLLLYAYFFG